MGANRMDEPFPGFDAIKRRFPAAESMPIAIDFQGPATSLFAAVSHLIGKINEAEFRGKAAQTVWFSGPVASEDGIMLRFVHRAEGWKPVANGSWVGRGNRCRPREPRRIDLCGGRFHTARSVDRRRLGLTRCVIDDKSAIDQESSGRASSSDTQVVASLLVALFEIERNDDVSAQPKGQRRQRVFQGQNV